MLESSINFLINTIHDWGYTGIIILMAIESSFFPLPSEIVMPPAGYLVAQGKMNMGLVILSGTVGSLLGALVNYSIAVFVGRRLLEKYGKFVFLTNQKLDKIEKFFNSHGEITTFVGRLIPGVRHYISFPAGLCRMKLAKFAFYTSLGAGIWVIVLSYLGYFVGDNIDVIKTNLHPITIITFCVLTVIISVYVYWHKKRRKNAS